MREEVFRGAFEEVMRWCACALMEVDTVCWFMLGCAALSVYCHTGGANKCTMRHICVLNTALYLAAAALCIEWLVRGG